MTSTCLQQSVAAAGAALVGALLFGSAPAHAHTVAAVWSASSDPPFLSGNQSSTTLARVITDSGLVHNSVNGIPFTFQGMAAADLRTGSLRTFAYADTVDSGFAAVPPQLPGGPFVGGTRIVDTRAIFEDTLTFAAPANVGGGVAVPVTIRMAVDGRFAGFYSHFDSKTFFTSGGGGSAVRSASAQYTWDGNQGPNASPIAIAVSTSVQSPYREPAQLHDLLFFTKLVTPGVPMYIHAEMTSTVTAGPYASGTVDFSHTAALAIEAPDGYTFTSSSGMLLAAPEPDTWLAMLVGLGMIVVTFRRDGASNWTARAMR